METEALRARGTLCRISVTQHILHSQYLHSGQHASAYTDMPMNPLHCIIYI